MAHRILMVLGIENEEAWRIANDDIPKAEPAPDAVAMLAAAMAKNR